MKLKNDGRAVVMVYLDGAVSAALVHDHDGGEAYMGPLLRKAVAYARVQYRSGDIVAILMAEEDTGLVTASKRVPYLQRLDVRHIYYLTATWEPEAGKKHYHVYARHLADGKSVTADDLPEFARGIPKDTTTLI